MDDQAPSLFQTLQRPVVDRVHCVSFVHAQDTLVSGGDRGLTLWNLAAVNKRSGGQARSYQLGGDEISAHGKGARSKSVSQSGIRNVSTDKGIMCLDVSQDEQVASGGRDRCLRLWRARIGNCGVGDRVHSGGIRGISFAADGRVLATASEDKTVKVWSVGQPMAKGPTGKKFLWCAKGHLNWVNGVAFGSRATTMAGGMDTRIASCSDDKTVRLWDVATKNPLQVWKDHADAVKSVRWFSPHCVVAGSTDRTINVWDSRTNRGAIQHYVAHSAGVNSVDLHPSGGYYMLSGSEDGTVRVWDIREGRLLYTLHAHTNAVNQVRFNTTGTHFASCGDDGRVLVWNSNMHIDTHTAVPSADNTARPTAVDSAGDTTRTDTDASNDYHTTYDKNTAQQPTTQTQPTTQIGASNGYGYNNNNNNNNNNKYMNKNSNIWDTEPQQYQQQEQQQQYTSDRPIQSTSARVHYTQNQTETTTSNYCNNNSPQVWGTETRSFSASEVRPTAPPPAPPATEKDRVSVRPRTPGVSQTEGGVSSSSRINDEALVHALQLFDARLRVNEDAVADLRHTSTAI